MPRMSTYTLHRKIQRSAPEEARQWPRNNGIRAAAENGPSAAVLGDRSEANGAHLAAVALGIQRNLEIPALSPKSTRGG